MGDARMVRQWADSVKGLLSSLHGHQINSLSDFSLAMCHAGHCHSGRLAAAVVSNTKPASSQRRWERLIANDDLDVYVAWMLWLRYVECIPQPFVLPGGREKVLAWVRGKLRRPELTAMETERELWWQAERMLEAMQRGLWKEPADSIREQLETLVVQSE